MNRKLIILLAALATLVLAPAAHAGCLPDAKVVHFDSGNHEEVGHAGMYCTTGNGTSYRLVLYIQLNDGDGWYTSGVAPQAYMFSYGGAPMPNNYVSADKVIRATCTYLHTDSFFPPDVRVHATLTNTNTNVTGVDDSPYRDYALVDQDCP